MLKVGALYVLQRCSVQVFWSASGFGCLYSRTVPHVHGCGGPRRTVRSFRGRAAGMTRKAITLTPARGIRDCGPTATTVCGTPSVPNSSGSASRHTRSRKSRVFHTGRMCAPVGLASRQRTSRSTSLTRAALPRPRTSAAAVNPRLPSLKRHGRSGCEPIIKGDRRPVQHMT